MDIAYKRVFLKWFGQNLKRARKESGYSQESLSELAGVDLSYYGAVERGERAITILRFPRPLIKKHWSNCSGTKFYRCFWPKVKSPKI